MLDIICISLHKLLILVLVQDDLSTLASYSHLLSFKQSPCLVFSKLWTGSLIACPSLTHIFHVLPLQLILLRLKLGYLRLQSLAHRVLICGGTLLWLVLGDWEIVDCPKLWPIVRHEFDLPSWDDLLLWLCLARDCMALRVLWTGWLSMLPADLIFHNLPLLWSLVQKLSFLHFLNS